MERIYQDLYQFSAHVPFIGLSFHQYLLDVAEPVLVHTGDVRMVSGMLGQLEEALGGGELRYVFISHFESDECGGLAKVLERYPGARPVCSEVTARQLSGFGMAGDALVKKPGEKLCGADFELEFIAYPSEMHLWDGLLAIENKRRIFFASDLLGRFGESGGQVAESDWRTEIRNIPSEKVPGSVRRADLQHALSLLAPLFVATGHGPCLRV